MSTDKAHLAMASRMRSLAGTVRLQRAIDHARDTMPQADYDQAVQRALQAF